MLYRTLHFLGSFCNTKNTSIKFSLVTVSKSFTKSDKWFIASNLRLSDLSFRIVSRAVNMCSLANSGPMIELISWRLEAMGFFTY